MNVKDVVIYSSRKSSVLASARVQLADSDGDVVILDDLRVLRNKQGSLWCALPTYSIAEGKSYRYEATITLSRQLQRDVEDHVLRAFDAWQKDTAADGGAR